MRIFAEEDVFIFPTLEPNNIENKHGFRTWKKFEIHQNNKFLNCVEHIRGVESTEFTFRFQKCIWALRNVIRVRTRL